MTCVAERMISASRAADVGQQRVEIELDVDLVAGGAEPIEAAFGDFFGDEDACHGDHRYRRNRGFGKELNDLFTRSHVDGYLDRRRTNTRSDPTQQ